MPVYQKEGGKKTGKCSWNRQRGLAYNMYRQKGSEGSSRCAWGADRREVL